MAYYPEPVARLIDALQRLPGIGPKTAQRLAFFLLKRPAEEVTALAESLSQLKAQIVYCRECGNVTQDDPCRICRDPRRDARVICVVEEPNDLLAIEKTGEFRGRYHVLMGALSPLDGIGPEDLKVRELLTRLEREPVEEIILATNPSVEGEATAIYLAKLLKPLGAQDHSHRPRPARRRRSRVRRRDHAVQGAGRPPRHVVAGGLDGPLRTSPMKRLRRRSRRSKRNAGARRRGPKAGSSWRLSASYGIEKVLSRSSRDVPR